MTLRSVLRSRELCGAAACALVLWTASLLIITIRHFEGMREHLGGESGNIALALVSGRGYSDPFAAHTGPTAWMPPMVPFLLAGLYSILHTRPLVGCAFSWLSIGLLAAAGGLLYRIAADRARALSAWFGLGLYLAWIGLFNFYFIVLTHDVGVIVFLLSLVAWQIHRLLQGKQPRALSWGVLGGSALLASPAAALAWGVSCFTLALARICTLRKALAALAVCVAVGLPWIARNAAVFHQFIPAKANIYCDLYVVNYVDDDGLWDYRTMYVHPYLSAEERSAYARLGERAYVTWYKQRFLERLAMEPRRFVRNVWRRVLAVTVKYIPSFTEADGPMARRCKRMVQPAMFLAALAAQFLKGPNQVIARYLAVVWLAFMLPYVVIGLHIRHVLPVSCILVLTVFLGLDTIAAHVGLSLSHSRHVATN